MHRRICNMNKPNYLPLGSVVQLEGGTQKLLIIARGLTMSRGGKNYFFDYGGVMYPQGLSGDQMAYFNHGAIRTLNFIGCNDSDNQAIVAALHKYVDAHPELEQCTPEEWDALR